MISTKVYKLMAVLAMAMLLTPLAMPSVAVAAQPATDGNGASGPLSGSVGIAPKAVQWYKFKYKYDNSQKDNASEVTILLKMDAADCVSFDVETPDTLATPAEEKHSPIGRGSPLTKKLPDRDPANEAKNADDAEDTNDDGKIDESENPYTQEPHGVVKNEQVLVWVGGGKATETFYVVVKNRSKAACNYQLMISGPTVSFPSLAATPTAAPAVSATATAQPAKSK